MSDQLNFIVYNWSRSCVVFGNMEKSWVWLPRNSIEYVEGANQFVNASSKALGYPSEIFCPCIYCRNVSHQPVDAVIDHLVIRGMDEKYKRKTSWTLHGDTREDKNDDVEISGLEAYELFRTAFSDNEEDLHSPKPTGSQFNNEETAEESEFIKKLTEAETPLYSSCHKYTKVSAIMGLYRIKVKSGMSENYFDQLLTMVHDMLPDENVLPRSTDEMKRFLKVKSEKYRKLRKSQIPHTTSRKGMFRLSVDMKKKSSDPKKVTRSKVWLAGHTHSDGRPVKKEFADTIERIQAIDSQMDSTATENVREDVVSQVLGKDRYGRVRGMGRGISLNKLDILNARDSYVQKLLATQTEMATKMENMQTQLDCLAGKKRSGADLDAQSNVSNTNKGGIKCKILDWFSKDEVVVGEGEFCTFDKGYKIGKIPIGPNAAAIILHSATIPDASIWRPTATVYKISQAVGVEIPWPDDKVVLESNNNSPTEHNMASDEQPIYNIFAWNGTDIVAEGIICSVDENEKINQIPLGPNAAIIKVQKVIDHGAFLWRPTAEMALMGDVLNECIQWPLHKIDVDVNTSPEVSPKKSTETTSKSTGTSKSSKQKCILLDCNGSGRVVAEGRVCSTDPDDLHFVPLGPNASKVWIDVSKIGDADVWRPNSEVVCVDDAKGTTIAWPNDKLKLV